MRDSEMWMVMKQESWPNGIRSGFELVCFPLSDVDCIRRMDGCLSVTFRNDLDYSFDLAASKDEGIVYKGTFVQCFDYINKMENFK